MSNGGPQWIEIIDADPAAFGRGSADSVALDRKPRRRLPRPPRPVLIGALVVAALVAGVLVWQQWADDDSQVLSLPAGVPTAPEMASELVLDRPPGPATSAGLGLERDGSLLLDDDLRIGYVLAAPDAHPGFSGNDAGRWVSFNAIRDNAPLAPVVDDQSTTIQGAPAASLDTGSPLLRFVVFGPVDGWMYQLEAHRLSEEETLQLAEALGVRDGVPVITDRAALAGLEPVGPVAAYDSLFRLITTPGDSSIPAEHTVFVKYGTGSTAAAVASIAAPTDDMTAMLDFVFPSGRAVTVHDLPAVAIGGNAALGLSTFQTVVVWVESGRIVMVGGMGGIDDTVALAESVRQATVDEWAEVALVAAGTPSPLDESVNPPGRVIASAVDPTTQVESKIAVTTQPDGAVLLCFSGPSEFGQQSSCEVIETPELPLFQTYNRFDQRWAFAMVAVGDAGTADLRVTYPDGHTESTQLSDYEGELTGAVAALGFGADRVAVELLINGVVVAHL